MRLLLLAIDGLKPSLYWDRVNFDDARLCDQLAYDLVLGDFPRGLNRTKIAEIANGSPPFTEEQVNENNIEVNVNPLTMTRRLHDARTQLANSLLKTGNYFTCSTDMGPKHRRSEYGKIVTSAINKRVKGSISYYEAMRSKIGLLVLHGISPAVWETESNWCPKCIGVEDALIPSNTLLGFPNLPFFIIRRAFTGVELQRLTDRAKIDPGWNMKMVKNIIEWVDKQTTQLRSTNWPEVWAPEKIAERVKQDGGYYLGDQVPTVDCFDVYGYVDDDNPGWVRRIILDSWGTPAQSGTGYTMARKPDTVFRPAYRDNFLYSSGARKVAKDWQSIISFQYADLSSVPPFRYHSVRSLGFLLYAVCHLQNRTWCKFNEAVLETLMQMFRVNSQDDAQRALQVDLINRGFIDQSINPIPAAERWQPNVPLVQLGLQVNQQHIDESSGAFAQRQDFSDNAQVEKTRFQVMAELNRDAAMVGAAMNQAYQYQTFEYREIVRRFFKKNSACADVQSAQAEMLRKGLPEKLMTHEVWETESERVMGGGNKTLEMTIAQQLMEWRPLFNPTAQNRILKDGVLALTDDPARADDLVPDQPHVSDSVHDTELVFGTLMSGNHVTPKPGLNAVEVAATIIKQASKRLQSILQSGSMADAQTIQGLTMATQYARDFVEQLAADETAKPMVKELGDALGAIENETKALAQRLVKSQQEAAQQAGQAGGGVDPKEVAKAEAIKMQAQVKAENTRESHAQRTAQRQIQFEQKVEQDRIQHAADLEARNLETATNIDLARQKADQEIEATREKAKAEPEPANS